ncbi:hypothetical protein B0H34DRAFT_336394 [Crassisporium funariophilum]|nr:hypothetical protein B0H34DRAFT_336394 [Crassisporium funariophilum]
MPLAVPTCCVCNKVKGADTEIKRCSGCAERFYCGEYLLISTFLTITTLISNHRTLQLPGKECQASDWKLHRRVCGVKPVGPTWYDKHRKCQDRSLHEGRLDLITWANEKEGTGWGNVSADESDDMRKKFEEEFGGDEEKLYDYWPQAFRWTCCGTSADMDWGCDHHGSGSRPCTCDFCRGGEALPINIYKEDTATRYGLKLQRGPDPRSRR